MIYIKVPSEFTSPVNELNNKTVCCPFEISPTNIPSEDVQTVQKLDLSNESLEDEVSVINNKHEDELSIDGGASVSFSRSRNNSFSLPEDNNNTNRDIVDVVKSKNSDKEEGELSSGDDEKENSFEDDSRAKKPRLNNNDDVSDGVGEDSINCSSNETSSLQSKNFFIIFLFIGIFLIKYLKIPINFKTNQFVILKGNRRLNTHQIRVVVLDYKPHFKSESRRYFPVAETKVVEEGFGPTM